MIEIFERYEGLYYGFIVSLNENTFSIMI